MYNVKTFALVALTVLFGGLFMSADAQIRRLPPVPVPPPPIQALSGQYTDTVNANQLSTGTVDYTDGQTYGWTCYGGTQGDLSGYMFVSMNYSTPTTPVDVEMDQTGGGGVSQVTSGSWSKLIFIDGQYAGSVHGTIVGGQVTWTRPNQSGTISLQLTSDDGTGSFAGSTGSGTFEGTWDPQSRESAVSGTLTLNY